VELLADATPEAQGQGDPQPVTSPVAGRSAQHIQVATPEGAATVAVASAEGAVLVAVASAEGQVAVAVARREEEEGLAWAIEGRLAGRWP